ncbi:uncharacterized protein [Solanum lycopersicum]|uniref:uncharacterized protein n=1 Tax=Solanum lycopersicum TaxID=4081 RepID=UPI003747FEF1
MCFGEEDDDEDEDEKGMGEVSIAAELDKGVEEITKLDATTGAIMCVEGEKSDAQALNIVESSIDDAYYIPEMDVDKHISDTNNSVVEENQMEMYGVEISYQQAWRAKERALELIRDKPVDGYINMPTYIYMLETVYPNSYIRMHKSKYNKFMYLFISLSPMMRGFEFCRPVVVVDASHLSGAYRGTFVSASTLDGAGCILPLTYEIVDTENDCSWTWFFQQFKNAFGERGKMCVVSDRNESIKKGVVPSSEFIFSVNRGGIRYIICVERKTCSCGRFQLEEIPCPHAITILKKKNITDVHPYCSDYYKHDALSNTYAIPIEPMLDKREWKAPDSVLEEVVLPPRYKKMSGRPRKKIKKNPDEKITTKTNCCGRCDQEGHNKRTCTFFPKDS